MDYPVATQKSLILVNERAKITNRTECSQIEYRNINLSSWTVVVKTYGVIVVIYFVILVQIKMNETKSL